MEAVDFARSAADKVDADEVGKIRRPLASLSDSRLAGYPVARKASLAQRTAHVLEWLHRIGVDVDIVEATVSLGPIGRFYAGGRGRAN